MSRYDVVANMGCCCGDDPWSSSSMTTHSELPVSGSSLSWKMRPPPEFMLRTGGLELERESERGMVVMVERRKVEVLRVLWMKERIKRRRFNLVLTSRDDEISSVQTEVYQCE